MSLFQTTRGKLNTDITGKGPLVIFLHGGPGLSASYLKKSFSPLSDKYKLLFFDQLGCGDSDLPPNFNIFTLTESAAELINLYASEERTYYIVAHSWGTYLLMRMLSSGMLEKLPGKIVLCNPVPFTLAKYNKVLGRFTSSFPQDVLQDVGKLLKRATNKDGADFMQLALPYYCGRAEDLPVLDFEYKIPIGQRIVTGMEDFDFTKDIQKVMDKAYFFFGNTDFIKPPDFQNLQHVNTLKGGHFIFEEDRKTVLQMLRQILVI